MYIITIKILTIPLFGLSLVVLYCDSNNPYHSGQTCYDSDHILFCLLAGIFMVLNFTQNMIFSFIYYNKSPLYSHYLAQPNSYYSAVKLLLKILLPLYYLIDPTN